MGFNIFGQNPCVPLSSDNQGGSVSCEQSDKKCTITSTTTTRPIVEEVTVTTSVCEDNTDAGMPSGSRSRGGNGGCSCGNGSSRAGYSSGRPGVKTVTVPSKGRPGSYFVHVIGPEEDVLVPAQPGQVTVNAMSSSVTIPLFKDKYTHELIKL